VLDERGEVVLEQNLGTTQKAMKEVFGGMPDAARPDRAGDRDALAVENRQLSELGTK
jgi:hypothetical protein